MSPRWFGPASRPLLGWMTVPEGTPSGVGVVLLPPIGYEYWTTHRSLRVLAERLADLGHLVLRMDYCGTGDSSGDLWDDGLVESWPDDVSAAVAELRRSGATSVSAVGLRFGANLAWSAGRDLGLDRIVTWMPVASTRRYLQELRLLSATADEIDGTDPNLIPTGAGTRFFAGNAMTPRFLDSIRSLTIDVASPPCEHVLVVDDDLHRCPTTMLDGIREAGVALEHHRLDGAEQMLSEPTEYATAPMEHIELIVSWFARRPQGDRRAARPEVELPAVERPAVAAPLTVHMPTRWGPVVEEVLRLGDKGLAAIETRPAEPLADAATVLFVNTGSEHHVGAGRVWVDFARQLAAEGHVAVRSDFRGWGESPNDGYGPGRPYDAQSVDDVAALTRALRGRGASRLVIVGICAGAWSALRECPSLPIDGIVAFNPQMYWQPGDPVEATVPETSVRRTAERRRHRLGRRVGLWSLLDALHIRPPAGRWVERIAAAPFPVWFCFASGDDGLEHLEDRLGRLLRRELRRGSIELHRLDRLDHPMHRMWHRDEGLEIVRAMLDGRAHTPD